MCVLIPKLRTILEEIGQSRLRNDPLILSGVDVMRREVDWAFDGRLAGAVGPERRHLEETREAMRRMMATYRSWPMATKVVNGHS